MLPIFDTHPDGLGACLSRKCKCSNISDGNLKTILKFLFTNPSSHSLYKHHVHFLSFCVCVWVWVGEESCFEGENHTYFGAEVLDSQCANPFMLQVLRRRRHAQPLQMGIVSAINAVPHSSPSPAKMEEHEYSLYITGKESEWSCAGHVTADHVYCIGHVTVM